MKVLYFILAVLSGFLGFFLLSASVSDFDPFNYGLGINTTSKVGIFNGDTVGIFPNEKDFSAIHSLQRTFSRYKAEDKKIALLIGASELHSINKIELGDTLAIERLNIAASNSNIRYVQVSSPNANFHDIFIIYKFLHDCGLHVNFLVLPFVYDDLRETPIQPQILPLAEKFDSIEKILCAPVVAEIEKESKESSIEENKDAIQRNATLNTPQEKLEFWVVGLLNKFLPGYQFRNKLTAWLEVAYTINLDGLITHTVGILNSKSSTTKVRYPDIPKDLEEWNSKAFESLIRLAVNHSCKVLIYRQPIRPTQDTFYHNREQYDSYFTNLKKKYSNNLAVQIADFENIVPQQYWGVTNLGEPDIFHFTQEGHIRLAKQIDSLMVCQTPLKNAL